MPIRHGLTIGELAQLFNGENKIGADLTVIAAKNWQRDEWFDETALPWINPSPNMRNLIQATVYPGIGAFETTNVSVGRGTDTPFEQLGAPWIDGPALADALNARRIPGVRFYPVRFTPTASKYAGQACKGVFMIVTDRAALRPVRLGRRDCGGAAQDVRGVIRAGWRRTLVRVARRHRAHSRWRGSGVDSGVVGRRRVALAAAPRPVSPLSLSWTRTAAELPFAAVLVRCGSAAGR